jgi:hypothetical protein
MGLQLTDLHPGDVTAAFSEIPFLAEVIITAVLWRNTLKDKGRAIQRRFAACGTRFKKRSFPDMSHAPRVNDTNRSQYYPLTHRNCPCYFLLEIATDTRPSTKSAITPAVE